MNDMLTRAKSLLDRTFPERQIYHRSGGTVRYVSISPKRQMIGAAGLAAAVVWIGFASINTLAEAPKLSASADALDRTEAKWERWVSETRAREATARSLLEERTEAFQQATLEFEARHDTLKLLLNSMRSPDALESKSLNSSGDAVLVTASIEEADLAGSPSFGSFCANGRTRRIS